MGTKMSFELDAGKILAKLHRGGCETRTDAVFINTGVTDDANIKPEQVDKNKINFDMEGGEYELGVILTKIPGNIDQNKLDIADAKSSGKDIKDIEDTLKKDVIPNVRQYLEKNKKEIDELDDKEWKALYGEFQKTNKGKDIPDENEFKEKIAELVGDADKTEAKDSKNKADDKTPITDNPNEKQTNESILFEDYTKMDPNQNSIEMDTLGDMLSTPRVEDYREIDNKAQKAPDDAKKAVENNRDVIKKAMEVNMKFACEYLNNYLLAFAGSDAAKVKPEQVQVTYIPEKFADPYKNKKYDKYQIPALTDAETRQLKTDIIKSLAVKKLNTADIFKNMCFKVAYSLDIGK